MQAGLTNGFGSACVPEVWWLRCAARRRGRRYETGVFCVLGQLGIDQLDGDVDLRVPHAAGAGHQLHQLVHAFDVLGAGIDCARDVKGNKGIR